MVRVAAAGTFAAGGALPGAHRERAGPSVLGEAVGVAAVVARISVAVMAVPRSRAARRSQRALVSQELVARPRREP